MQVFWLEATPWDIDGAEVKTVRACSADLAPIVGFGGGQEWLPVLAAGPVFDTSVFTGQFTGTSDSTRGSIELMADAGEIDEWARYGWAARSVKVWTATIDTSNPLSPVFPTVRSVIFDGEAESFDPDQAGLLLSIRKPVGTVASEPYLGTGGLEGAASLKDVVKPFAAGEHVNRPPTLVDPTKLLFQVHAYGEIEDLIAVRERGMVLDQIFVPHATATSLMAATVPATEIHYHLGTGTFRLGFTPAGNITADFIGHRFPSTPAAQTLAGIVATLLVCNGWDSEKIDAASFAYVDSELPYTCTYHDEAGEDVLGAITRLMLGAGGYWDVDELGVFYIGLVGMVGTADFSIGDEDLGLADYDLSEIDHVPVRAPFWRTRVAYARNPVVMNFSDTEAAVSQEMLDQIANLQDEIDGKIDIYYQSSAPVGANADDQWYDTDDGKTYRWVIGTGWVLMQDSAIAAAAAAAAGAQSTADGKITTFYQSGTPTTTKVGDLWVKTDETPRQVRSWSGSAWQVVSSVGATAGGNLYRADGSTVMTQGEVRTPEGTAAAIAGQGSLATSNAANWQTQVLGIGKPSNYAGTSRLLKPIGSYSVLTGNSLMKVGGTHGVFEGGAVGVRQRDTAFISSSCLYDNTNNGGWNTYLALDPSSETAVAEGSFPAGAWLLQHFAASPDVGIILYKHNGTSWIGHSSWNVAGLTYSSRRIALCYNGRRVFVMVDGVQYGGDNAGYDVAPGTNFYPKVLDFHRSELIPLSIDDIQYGPWNDARTYLDDGQSILNQAGFRTIEGTAAAITGQGPGATASARDVLNYEETSSGGNGITIVRTPGGGQYSNEFSATAGCIVITLPVGFTNTMLRFSVDIYNYQTNTMQTYIISGYNYNSPAGWHSCTAQYVGSELHSKRVRFGYIGARCVIWIGETTSVWQYPKVMIRDVMAGYSNNSAATWRQGWAVTLDAAEPVNVSAEVTKPRPGDAVFGEGVFEAPGGSIATTNNFKTILGTAAAFAGQGSLATKNFVGAPDIVVSSLSALSAELGNVLINSGSLIVSNGVTMKVIANGFGTSNQFMEWAGPAMALNLCSEANATSYLKTNGDAYFGGTLFAGALKNGGVGTATSPTASFGTGPFGSNGGNRVITLSYSWEDSEVITGACPSGTVAVTIRLYRGSSAAGTLLATLNVSGGSFNCNPGAGPFEPGGWQVNAGGSLTYTDTAGGLTAEYFAVITSRTVPIGSNSKQRIGVYSVEG